MDKLQAKLDFDFITNQSVLRHISNIDSFKGKWNIVEQTANSYLKELRNIATVESIGSSTRIEGAKLSNPEIEILLKQIKISELKTRDEQEVVGYYDVLEIIYENYNEIKLSQNYILELHNKLLIYSAKDVRHRGKYKSLSNEVVAKYPNGTQKVIFKTTEPHLVQKEMMELIRWTNKQLKSGSIHPLIAIALFVYEFLSIHPFQDGNGRLSRLVTTLLLLKYGYHFIQYVSFENLIEQKKKNYYKVLMDGQKKRNTKKEKVDKWILFFLSSIEELIQRLEQKYNVYKSKSGYLNERQNKIFDFIKENQPIKLGDLNKAFPNVSINTLKKDLQYMKAEQVIQAIGKNRGTVYHILDS